MLLFVSVERWKRKSYIMVRGVYIRFIIHTYILAYIYNYVYIHTYIYIQHTAYIMHT